MTDSPQPPTEGHETESNESILERAQQLLNEIRAQVTSVVIGQDKVVDEVLQCFIAGGHVLIEGVPGLAKTLLVRALARCFDGAFQRIQFTPDLMPSDVTGHSLFNLREGQFETRRGPIFTNLLLADEINRAPAKTQSALLEVMQEKHVTIDLESFALDPPFMVLATQNPIEQDGTYPLPEAQLDRFLMKVLIDYPDEEAELKITTDFSTGEIRDNLDVSSIRPFASAEDINALKESVIRIRVDDSVLRYAVALVRETRTFQSFAVGAGPRASLALIRLSQAAAIMESRDFVTPDDIKQVCTAVLRHRVSLTADLEIEGMNVDESIQQLLSSVPAPRL